MNTRNILITIGSLILILLLGVWVYLMIYGTPENRGDVLKNLGFQPSNQGTTITPPSASDSIGLGEIVNTIGDNQALRQLTTRPVAGYIGRSVNGTTTDHVRYVERGTSHIYEIDLSTGVESKISITTIPQITEAIFSPSGDIVALTNEQNYERRTYIATLQADQTLRTIELEPNARDIVFLDDTTVQYVVSDQMGSIGYRQNLLSETRTSVFSFNHTSIDTLWGDAGVTPVILTKPAPSLRGYMYRITGTTVTPVGRAVNGLTAFRNDNQFILTYLTSDGYVNSVFDAATAEEKVLPILTLKEKCDRNNVNAIFIWCGAPITVSSNTFVDDWYKGIERSEDHLWLINLETATAQLLINPERILGRTLDVFTLKNSALGDMIFFLNKDDYTLWQYDLLLQ